MKEEAVDDLLARGRAFAMEDRAAEAERTLLEALALARGSSLLESRVCCSLGTFYARDGRQFESIMLYRYSLDQARQAGDRMLEVRLLANLCNIFTELERWDPLAGYLAQADAVITYLTGDEREEAQQLVAWSRFYWTLQSRDAPSARAHLANVRVFMRQHDDPSSQALLHAWESDLLMLEGKPLAALELLERAREIEGVIPAYRLDVLSRAIECLVATGQREEADALGAHTLDELEALGAHDPLVQVSHETAATLGRYFDRRGHREHALRAYDIAATAALRRIVQLAECIARVPELADTCEEDHHQLRALRGEYLGIHREILDRVARLLEERSDHVVFTGDAAQRMVRVCAWCGLVATKASAWIPAAHLVPTEMEVPIAHGICPRCSQKAHPAEPRPVGV